MRYIEMIALLQGSRVLEKDGKEQWKVVYEGSLLEFEVKYFRFKSDWTEPIIAATDSISSPNFGFMEFVEDSVSVRDFDINLISKFEDETMDEFLATAAGGYIGGFLLGIRDRHEDNLMIKGNNKFFQLDFKHAFNNRTFGIDGCRFAISKRLKTAIDSNNTPGRWQNFKDRTAAAYLVLRRNSQIIVQLCRLLFNEIYNNSQIELEMLKGFYLDRTEDQATRHIQELLELGVVSMKRVMKNMTHCFSGNIKPKS